jgi:hypothetical protein
MLNVRRFASRRFASLGIAALMLMLSCGAFFASTGVASAHAGGSAVNSTASVSCSNYSCDGKNPITTGCSSDAIVPVPSQSADLGGGLTVTIYLRWSYACGAAWAVEVFNQPVPSNVRGDARLWRKDSASAYNGSSVSCQSSGGNGKILPGQTSCFSAMLGDAYTGTSCNARGYVSLNSGSSWILPVETAYY